jgi:hypothetical protein
MSIDDLGRAAATDARRRAAREVDPTTMLERLHHSNRSRTVGWIVTAVAIVTVGAVALIDGGGLSAGNQTGGSATRPSSTNSACTDTRVTCLGGDRYLVALPVPVTVTLPANFQGSFTFSGTRILEDYRTDADGTGVTVMENATPVKDNEAWVIDPSAGTTAESMARWLSKRPFLIHATIIQTEVGGRTAWHVSADLKPGAATPAFKYTGTVAPTFFDSPGSAGYGAGLTGNYTLLDTPGAGVTVIWSWAGSDQLLAGNQTYVNGLSFG